MCNKDWRRWERAAFPMTGVFFQGIFLEGSNTSLNTISDTITLICTSNCVPPWMNPGTRNILLHELIDLAAWYHYPSSSQEQARSRGLARHQYWDGVLNHLPFDNVWDHGGCH